MYWKPCQASFETAEERHRAVEDWHLRAFFLRPCVFTLTIELLTREHRAAAWEERPRLCFTLVLTGRRWRFKDSQADRLPIKPAGSSGEPHRGPVPCSPAGGSPWDSLLVQLVGGSSPHKGTTGCPVDLA